MNAGSYFQRNLPQVKFIFDKVFYAIIHPTPAHKLKTSVLSGAESPLLPSYLA
jgi:hypothetical protein